MCFGFSRQHVQEKILTLLHAKPNEIVFSMQYNNKTFTLRHTYYVFFENQVVFWIIIFKNFNDL
jgi:hypothetical protein